MVAVLLEDAPTFIDCSLPPFAVSVFIKQLPNSASAGDPLVWRKFPAASWWSDLLPPLNLLVSFPSPVREIGMYGVGHTGGVVADHSV